MSDETSKAFITIAGTVLSGTIVAVAGHVASVLFIQPIQNLRRALGEISDKLSYYANVYTGWWVQEPRIAPDRMAECATEMRRLSTLLLREANCVPCYDAMAGLGVVPKREDVLEASGRLIFLSNSQGSGDVRSIVEARETIEARLSLLFKRA